MKRNLTLAVFLLIGSAISMAADPINNTVINEAPFQITTSAMKLDFWCNNNTLDESTKTITFNNIYNDEIYSYGGQVGWDHSASAIDVTSYKYLVIALNNSSAPSQVQIRLCKESTNLRGYIPLKVNADNVYVENNIASGSNHLDLNLKEDYFRNQAQYEDNKEYLDPTNANKSVMNFTSLTDVIFWECGGNTVHKINFANVFLTNTLPDWDNPVPRTTTSGNYGTVCLPYPAICTDGYVYQIKSVNSAKTKIGIEPYNGVMRAGVPYIYKSIGDGVNFYEIKDSRVLASVGGSNNGLIGCLNATTSITKNSNLYVLHNNMWYLVDSDNFSSAANRAYIDISQITPADDNTLAKGMIMDLSEETTGVNTINVSNNGEEEATYTITGVKLGKDATLQRGIYIRGGKKFVVK
jgi:hypothetical protein